MATAHEYRDQPGDSRLLNARELAALIGTTPRTILNWKREGIIPAIQVGQRFVRFDADKVFAALGEADDRRGVGQ